MKKTLVIIAARGIGDLIYHLPLLRSLYESYNEKLIILSNKVNHSKEVYKFETFYKEIIEFENTRFSFFKTLKTINNLKNIINKCNVDQLILTASPRRLMMPVYLSDVKEKIIFGQGKFFFTKNNKYQYLTHADKIMKYTENLNLPTKIKNFNLTKSNFKSIDETKKKPHIFINLDSHHDQNNWNVKNYINIISQLLIYELKIYINFSPTKLYFLKLLPKEILNSDKIVIPGVGHFKSALNTLKMKGIDVALKKVVEKYNQIDVITIPEKNIISTFLDPKRSANIPAGNPPIPKNSI